MFEAITYDNMINNLKEKLGDNKKTVGILLAKPTSVFVQEEILNNLNYYHHRSGNNLDFYLPGYGAYWNNTYPDEKNVCTINGTKRSFSTKKFVEFVEELEQYSKWKYSGETELILLDYVNGKLDFSNTLILWLDRMIKDNSIHSVPNSFEKLFRLFRNNNIDTFSASDKLTSSRLKGSLASKIIKQLPFKVGEVYKESQYFCIRNLSE